MHFCRFENDTYVTKKYLSLWVMVAMETCCYMTYSANVTGEKMKNQPLLCPWPGGR